MRQSETKKLKWRCHGSSQVSALLRISIRTSQTRRKFPCAGLLRFSPRRRQKLYHSVHPPLRSHPPKGPTHQIWFYFQPKRCPVLHFPLKIDGQINKRYHTVEELANYTPFPAAVNHKMSGTHASR